MSESIISRTDDKNMVEAERSMGTADASFYAECKKATGKNCTNFFGHSKVSKQSVVKNPPPQPSQLGKDGFYSNVSNRTGKL